MGYNSRMKYYLDPWCPIMIFEVIRDFIFDTKDEPILQNSSQEPSIFSKYDCVLDAPLVKGEENWYTTK